jgi:hypothetical protein
MTRHDTRGLIDVVVACVQDPSRRPTFAELASEEGPLRRIERALGGTVPFPANTSPAAAAAGGGGDGAFPYTTSVTTTSTGTFTGTATLRFCWQLHAPVSPFNFLAAAPGHEDAEETEAEAAIKQLNLRDVY